jgi:hypothetical protein
LIFILLAMLLIVLLAALVVVYVTYPHRGEDVPNAPWMGDAMRKGVALLPTLDNQGGDRGDDRLDDRLGDRGMHEEQRR